MTRGAVLLAGGESRRMGRPKADLDLGGVPFARRVADTLSGVVGAANVVVVRAAGQASPELPAGVILTEDREPGRGPLEGFAAGLAALPACESVFLAACDAPLLRGEFVRLMFAELESGGAFAAVPLALGYRHPLCAAYRVGVREVVAETLAAGESAMGQLLARLAVRYVHEARLREVDAELASLRNVNTPGEYWTLIGGDVRATSPPRLTSGETERG